MYLNKLINNYELLIKIKAIWNLQSKQMKQIIVY